MNATDPKEDWHVRMERERKEETARYRELYEGVAKYLPDWQVKTKPLDIDGRAETPAWVYRLVPMSSVDMPGQCILMTFGQGAKRNQIHVSGYWPQSGPNMPYTSPSDVNETSPSINISVSKSHEQIARDIARRFIPDYQRVFKLLTAKIQAAMTYEQSKLDAWKQLVDAECVRNPQVIAGRDPMGDVPKCKGKGYGDVRLTGPDSVEIHFRSVSVSEAIRILKAV